MTGAACDVEVAGADLLVPARLAACLRAMAVARYTAQADPRAVAGQWSKYYFGALLPPALGPALDACDDRLWPVDAVRLRLRGGVPVRASAATAEPARADRTAALAALLPGHLAPLQRALAAAGGLPAKVFWANLGNALDAALAARGDPAAAELADRLFAPPRAAWSDGPNPLYRPVVHVPPPGGGAPRRVRRVCCLRYLIAGEPYCGSCPIPPARRLEQNQ